MHIELHQVTKRFGKVEALRDVTLDIPSGRAVALVGPNGSGKSTLTRAVMGLIAVRGQVLLDGVPRARAGRIVERIAYVPQITPQFGAPVGELVRLVCRLRGVDRAEVQRLCAALDLDLDRVDKQAFKNLSGGMKQKVLNALALASRPSLLLMDEPTASLDAEARERFFRLFESCRDDCTLLLTSHRIEEIRHLVEHAVALRDGTVTYDGPATRYLADRAQSVIEVMVHANGDRGWLESQGFRAGAPGWWVKVVSRAEKLAIVPDVTNRFGSRLENIVVRDLERLELRASDEREAHRA